MNWEKTREHENDRLCGAKIRRTILLLLILSRIGSGGERAGLGGGQTAPQAQKASQRRKPCALTRTAGISCLAQVASILTRVTARGALQAVAYRNTLSMISMLLFRRRRSLHLD